MTQIDPTRISRVLASLTKPKERTDANAELSGAAVGSQRTQNTKVREPAALKARLQQRLKLLRNSDADFQEAAPTVAVQEILLWEFGDDIVKHAEFERVAHQVTLSLLDNEPLKAAIQNLIAELSA